MTSHHNTYQVFWGAEGLNQLKILWFELTELPHNNVFYLDWYWYKNYLKHLSIEPDSFFLFFFHSEKTGNCILPLELRRKINLGKTVFSRIQSPKHDHLNITGYLIEKIQSEATFILVHLIKALKFFQIRWDEIIISSTFLEVKNDYIERLTGLNLISKQIGYSNALDVNKQKLFDTQLSKKNIKNIIRLEKKAKKLGALDIRFSNKKQEIDFFLKKFFLLEQSGWKGESGVGSAICLNEQLKSFYIDVVEDFFECSKVQINSLSLAGEIIASQLCLKTEKELSVIKIAYNEKWAMLSPGNILLMKLIENSLENCAIENLFFVTDAPWMQRWHFDRQKIYSHYVFNNTIQAHILQSARKTKSFLESI